MPNRARTSGSRDGVAALKREAIVRAAIALADAEGLDAVSIRRVAVELGTRPMSLYTYFSTKDELLAVMADEIVGEVLVADQRSGDQRSGDWREAVRRIAWRSHETFVSHPWVLEISGRRPDLGRNALRHAEQLLDAIAPLGLAPGDAWKVLFVVNDYTLGHALRVAYAASEPQVGFPAFEAVEYPRLADALGAAGEGRGEASFEVGLEAVLEGIERRFG